MAQPTLPAPYANSATRPPSLRPPSAPVLASLRRRRLLTPQAAKSLPHPPSIKTPGAHPSNRRRGTRIPPSISNTRPSRLGCAASPKTRSRLRRGAPIGWTRRACRQITSPGHLGDGMALMGGARLRRRMRRQRTAQRCRHPQPRSPVYPHASRQEPTLHPPPPHLPARRAATS